MGGLEILAFFADRVFGVSRKTRRHGDSEFKAPFVLPFAVRAVSHSTLI